MSTVKIPLDQAIKFISEGVEQALASRIKEAVAIQAEKIVEEVAKDLTKGIKSSLKAYEEAKTGEIMITLNIVSLKSVEGSLIKEEKSITFPD